MTLGSPAAMIVPNAAFPFTTLGAPSGGVLVRKALLKRKQQLPSWVRRGGAKRRGGSKTESCKPALLEPPLAGSASRSRCPP